MREFKHTGRICLRCALILLPLGNLKVFGQVEHAKLTAADATGGASFGSAAAMNGNRLVVGARFEGIGGSAYIFRRDDNATPTDPLDDVWVQEAKLNTSAPFTNDWIGSAVNLHDGFAVVGAPRDNHALSDSGAAYVFRRDDMGTAEPTDDSWTELAKLVASDAARSDLFGASVSISGEWIVIGANNNRGSCPAEDTNCRNGAAYAFRLDDSGTPGDPTDDIWVQHQRITVPGLLTGAWFGGSVALKGDWLVVGASLSDELCPGFITCDSGSAFVFHLDDNGTPGNAADDGWVQHTQITASDPGVGDLFGFPVAIDGDRLVIGALADDDACMNDSDCDSGSAYAFRRDDNGTPADVSDDVWIEEAKLTASDAARDDHFGGSIAINGNRILVAATGDDAPGAGGAGALYVFRLDDGGTPLDPSDDTWREERKVVASDPVFGAGLGWSAAILGDWAVAGAPGAATGGVRTGAVYAYLVEGDCNGNGVLDETDIAAGTSRDCNANAIPDECEIDCQNNCIPDSCDLATGASPDADADGIPDECTVSTNPDFFIDVTPRTPVGVQPVSVSVLAVFPESCYTTCDITGEWISADEFHVDFGVRDLSRPGEPCIPVITTLRADFSLGTLAPGDYRVTATEYITPLDPPCSDRTLMDTAVMPFRVLTDCNANGTSDTCDVIAGPSLDCNADDVPDECQTDCNGNTIPDDCDLAAGTSPDCNTNGVPDECDVASGTSPDCNGNIIPDACDLAAGTSPDCNANGVPDECDADCNANGVTDACECFVVNPPVLRATEVPKNRYLSVTPDPLGLGCRTALRVTFSDLPPPFELFNGRKMWAGPPQTVNEEGGSIIPVPGLPDFTAARLQCDPVFAEWRVPGTVHLYHSAIVPGGTYAVQAVGEGCFALNEADFSAPLSMTQGVWGDVVGRFDSVNRVWMAPDGIIEIISDCLAIIDKFADRPAAPIKTRADIEPATPDQLINISDVVRCVDAFRGRSYPFTPDPPPCP